MSAFKESNKPPLVVGVATGMSGSVGFVDVDPTGRAGMTGTMGADMTGCDKS